MPSGLALKTVSLILPEDDIVGPFSPNPEDGNDVQVPVSVKINQCRSRQIARIIKQNGVKCQITCVLDDIGAATNPSNEINISVCIHVTRLSAVSKPRYIRLGRPIGLKCDDIGPTDITGRPQVILAIAIEVSCREARNAQTVVLQDN